MTYGNLYGDQSRKRMFNISRAGFKDTAADADAFRPVTVSESGFPKTYPPSQMKKSESRSSWV